MRGHPVGRFGSRTTPLEPSQVGNGDHYGNGQAQDGRELLGVDDLLQVAVDEPEVARFVPQPTLNGGKWARKSDQDDPQSPSHGGEVRVDGSPPPPGQEAADDEVGQVAEVGGHHDVGK